MSERSLKGPSGDTGIAVSGSAGRVGPLAAGQLYRAADLSRLSFKTTADLQPVDGPVGQARALSAVRFGTGIDKPGFNLFVIGPNGARMRDTVKDILVKEAAGRPAPTDWVYVNNFSNPDKPTAIELPAGRARGLAQSMHELIDDLKAALPAVFQSEDYQTRRSAIDETFQKKQGEAFASLRDKAAEKSVVIVRTPFGFALAPAENGQIVPPDQFHTWPEEKRSAMQKVMEVLESDLERIMHQIPQWERERRDDIRKLNRDSAKFAVDQLIEEAKSKFSDLERILDHIEKVRSDLVENVAMFIVKADGDEQQEPVEARPGNPFDRYEVNVLVAQDGQTNAPIVEELHPTLGNLIGRIEYISSRGVLMTNFRLIKAGALHRANGGYLLLDVRSLLMESFSWTALKRTLRRGDITIEDVGRFLGLTSTISLEPDPIPVKVKVVLFGERLLYFLLAALDPEVSEYFKVLADFENDIQRTPENEELLARLIATLVAREGLKPLDREAVALALEHAARLADHAGKLTLMVENLTEVLSEADYWAKEAGASAIAKDHLQKAIDERIYRASRLRDRSLESIVEKIALIDTEGRHVGQINGLSVLQLGGFSFGRPTRITCQVRPGGGRVVDIEREVELGGPIHSKGVLILSGFLAGRYALDTTMSLFASLVFEQSYSGVEGDSASSAELYALLSALAETPLRQDLAVTGSVNQHGEVQAIGGVNEKIEGFFDLCQARGLTGTQGVLIPQANVQHLMLRADVVEACVAGRFAVYPIGTIDEGVALLTGLEAGVRGVDGRYPADSINRRVEDRLRAFAEIRRQFDKPGQQALTKG